MIASMSYVAHTVSLMVATTVGLGPSSSELAKAVAEFTRSNLAAAEIRRVVCERIEEEPTEARCSWHQKNGDRWERFQSYLAVDAGGWHLIDEPAPIE